MDRPHAARPGRRRALLLVGPSGSGKTPLGEELERGGLRSARCVHFDFGAELRRIAAGGDPGFSPAEAAFLAEVVAAGRLLEDEHFPLARRILESFLAARGFAAGDICVLNGLPRHAGQARDLEPVLDVRLVVHLSCPAEVAWERIRTDAGGDRSGRSDDDLEAVRRRLELFRGRIAPLLGHYRARGVRVEEVAVGPQTTAESARRSLEAVLAVPAAGSPFGS
ncbi:MAG TPA: nucleoside monophosphate kinase [Planctomycetota bacterium]|nr:nucleoside monophosphate kinase [Planctomycetota bacterium]